MIRTALMLGLLAASAHAQEAQVQEAQVQEARAKKVGPSFGSPFRFTEASGAAIYGSVCAGCHMADGRGASGAAVYPSLADDPRLAASAYSIARVLRGRGAMPPFARTLSDEQVAAVVGFIRTSFDNGLAGAPTAADVATQR